MKTPLQEFKDKFFENSRICDHFCPKGHQDEVIDLDVLCDLLDEMLEKEKALLIETHGNKKVYTSQIDPIIVTGEDWYNRTFKTKEQ